MTSTRAIKIVEQQPRPRALPGDWRAPALAHSLPIPLTSLVGRGREQAEIGQLLSTTRLLTLTGAAGCGKTRLALAAAQALAPAYRDGAALVDLAELTGEANLAQALAAALGIRAETPAALVAALRCGELLLVLDTCEHLAGPCASLARALLSSCPGLRILATSREALGVAGETIWQTPSLGLPDPQHLHERNANLVSMLMQSEAVALFVDRAAAARPAFHLTPQNALAVAQICRRLDGLPLAIELAAARVKLLTPAQIAARLDDRLGLLVGGRAATPRHQSLRAAIDWSYALLPEQERALFRQLAVFVGGWTLEAAEAVCEDCRRGTAEQFTVLDLLTALVDKSLVVAEEQPDGEARYRLLETFQQYARERLADADPHAGEAESARRRHAEHFLALADASERELRGPQQLAWLERLEREHDNMRAALSFCVGARDLGLGAWDSSPKPQAPSSTEIGARLASALWRFWWMRSHWAEGRRWLEQALLADGLTPAVRAKALHCSGVLADEQGDYATAQIFYERALAIRRELGDVRGATASLNSLGCLMRDMGNHARARVLFEESLALRRQLGDQAGLATVLSNLGQLLIDQGEYAQAQARLEECLALDKRLGDTLGIATVLGKLGELALTKGEYARAAGLLEESLGLSRALADSEAIAEGLENLAAVAVAQGQAARAVRLLGAAEALRDTIGAPVAPAERADYERTLALAGAQLDPATFALTWSQGRAMPLDRALAPAAPGDGAEPDVQQSGGELAALTEEFNRMAGRVAELVRQQRAEAQTRERIEHELRVARLIQQTLLPQSLPALPGWGVAAHYQPARAVGGDFYDFIPLPDGRLGLVIGDVTDKGVPAALVMATTRSILRSAAERFDAPGEVLARANELLCPDIPPRMFVTCLYATIDPSSGLIRYANAGHVLPLRRGASGVDELRATGMPLGALPGMRYEERALTLAPGESLLFYSDGLVEAHNPQREIFGFPRLRELTARRPAADALLIGSLLHELERFAGPGAEQEDDITLVTLQRLAH